MAPISAIKLIRTDTTLDLSQKAEKGMKLGKREAIVIKAMLYHHIYVSMASEH